MSTDPKPALPDGLSLPEAVRLRRRKFGADPVSGLVSAPVRGDRTSGAVPCPAFELRWEDRQLGLTVLVREREDGRLIADVFCTDAGLRNRAAVSVGLVGTVEDSLIRKTIALDMPEKAGCSGAADFGRLTDAVNELGPQFGVVVILLEEP